MPPPYKPYVIYRGGGTQPQIWIIEEKTPLNPRVKGIEKRAPHKYVVFFAKKGGNIGKKTYWRTYQGEKKKIKRKNGQKNILDDLQAVKRRKNQEKMAKYPTGGLTRGKKKKINSKNGKKNILDDLPGVKTRKFE